MNQKDTSVLEKIQLGVYLIFFVLFSWLQWWAGVSPRLIRGSEERLRIHHEHLQLGATIFLILCVFFIIWAVRPGQSPLAKLRTAFKDVSASAVSLFLIAAFLSMVFGLNQAWSKGDEPAIFGLIAIPHFVNFSWETAGYMHASLSTITVYLFYGVFFVFLFRKLRNYMPSILAVILLLGLHVLVNLPKPPSPHPIAMVGTYIIAPAIYFIALGLFCFANNKRWIHWPIYIVLITFFLYLPYFAFKVLPPWHQTASAEVAAVEAKTELAPVRSTAEIFPTEQSLETATDTASWCRQCHSVEKGAEHLLGPNLTGVYNRQIALAEGYGRYSKALVEKGAAGEYWTRENLSMFLQDGQKFAPGNLMNQQTDLSDPEKLKQVIDYLEYLSAQ